ncbi:Rv3235 family protein, partial [Paenarthrobacter sp. RAF9]
MTVTTPSRPASRQGRSGTGVVRSSNSADVDVRLVARSIAQAALEVLAGTRPLQQLSRSLDAECYLSLQH